VSRTIDVRIARATSELLDQHLELLIILLAEAGVDRREQRERMNGLVRALDAPRIERTLIDDGRRVVSDVNLEHDPPIVRLNGGLIERVADDELRAAFAEPISQILGVSPLQVSLVIQGTGERALRDLYNKAQRRLEERAIRVTEVQAILRRRITAFARRLRDLVERLSGGERIQLESPRSFMRAVHALRVWPEWEDIRDEGFITSAIEAVDRALEDVEHVPSSESIVELCWESLTLSPPSIIRHTARVFRNQAPEKLTASLLRAVAGTVTDSEHTDLEDVANWPAFGDLGAAWRELFVKETGALGVARSRDEARMLSVFEPPRHSTGLHQPENLPWELPLAAWTTRETRALRDLLEGFAQTIPDSTWGSSLDVRESAAPARAASEHPLILEGGEEIETFVVPCEPPAEGSRQRLQRAWDASLAHLRERFVALDDARQGGVLQRLHGVFTGFFPGARTVWERRFQSWERDEPLEAFGGMVTGLQPILGAPILLDPFERPDGREVAPFPSFVLPVPFAEGAGEALFRVPIPVLLTTDSGARLVARCIELSDEPPQIRWIGDVEVDLDTVQRQSIKVALSSVVGDGLQLRARRTDLEE
jgi:hypothetical protein